MKIIKLFIISIFILIFINILFYLPFIPSGGGNRGITGMGSGLRIRSLHNFTQDNLIGNFVINNNLHRRGQESFFNAKQRVTRQFYIPINILLLFPIFVIKYRKNKSKEKANTRQEIQNSITYTK